MPERKPRLVLQAVAGDRCVLDVSEPHWRKYADKVGADYIAIHTIVPTENPCQPKLWLDFYANHYEQTLWVDADTLPMPDAPDIFSDVPQGHFGVMENAHLAKQHPTGEPLDKLLGLFPHGYFHAGVMVFPSIAGGLMADTFSLLANRTGVIAGLPENLLYYEQTALNQAWATTEQPPLHRLDYRYNAYLEDDYIPLNFPSNPTLFPAAECWFIHFAGGAHLKGGLSQQDRAVGMVGWIERNLP